jgi:hypothetical protein
MHKTKYTFKVANETVSVEAVINYIDDERISITVNSKQDALLLAYHYTGFASVIEECPNGVWGLVVYGELPLRAERAFSAYAKNFGQHIPEVCKN